MTDEQTTGQAQTPQAPEPIAAPLPEPAPVTPEPDAALAEERKIWDPASKRWVSEADLVRAQTERQQPPGPQSSGPQPRRGSGVIPHWLTAVVAGTAGGALAISVMLFVPGVTGRRQRIDASPRFTAFDTGPSTGAAELAKGARAWVVNIAVTGSVPTLLGPREFSRTGSGIVMRADGVIATTSRLVQGAGKIVVTTSVGKRVEAKLAGIDSTTDVAVLQVDEKDLAPAVLGTTEILELGDPVVAVSAPTGTQTTVQAGAISAVGRAVDPGDGELLLDMLQVGAPLPAGGSGGVLVGQGSSAVGMTASVGDTSNAIGYAVPIDIVRSVTDQIMAGQKVGHPWLGLTIDQLDGDTAFRLDVRGAIVASVFDTGPAAASGIKPGDLVTAIDGAEVRGPLSLLKRVLDHKAGDSVTLSIRNGDARRDVKLTVADRPSLR